MIKSNTIRFIKLGSKGSWEKDCIDSDKPSIRLGFNNPHHQKCIEGNWGFIKDYWQEFYSKREASKITNMIKDFYTQPSTTMWITFYGRKLYWCFVNKEVKQLEDGSRIREVIGKWSYCDINDKPLYVENLSGKLTKVQMFKGTICQVKESDYLLKRINAIELQEVKIAKESFNKLIEGIKPLIKNFAWQDFELLVDLIFSNAGWQRIAVLGKAEKFLDLDVISPVTGQRVSIQIKSQSSKDEFKKYIEDFKGMSQYDEMYYICHTGDSTLKEIELPANVKLMGLDHISELTVNAGLVKWVITKAS